MLYGHKAGGCMLDEKTRSELQRLFGAFPEIVAVYLFGSYPERKERAGDVDLAVLLKIPHRSMVDLYLDLYPGLVEIFAPLEVDLLFLNSASLPLCFEVVSTGGVVYCGDEDRRTDFEYVVSGRYMDFKYHLEVARLELYEAIREGTTLVQS